MKLLLGLTSRLDSTRSALASLEALRGAHACVGVGTVDYDATMAVQALDAGSAAVQALELFVEAARTAGLSPRPISELEVTRWDVFELGRGSWSQESAGRLGPRPRAPRDPLTTLPFRRESWNDGDLAE